MITNFKLFLENINTDDVVIEITLSDWNYAWLNDRIVFPENSLIGIRAVFNPRREFYFDYDDTRFSISAESNFYDQLNLFMDNDYWLYVNYSMSYKPGFRLDEIIEPTELYHKIDIGNGYDNVPEYLNIIEAIRDKLNIDDDY